MLLLDVLIATLVLLPLFVDAFWFDMPLSIEPSDLGVPLLIAALVAMAVRRRLWRTLLVVAAFFLLLWFLPQEAWERHRDAVTSTLWYLTHAPGAVLVVALAAAAIQRWSPEPWHNSFFVRLGTRLGRAWLEAVQRSPRPLWTAAGAMAALLLWVSLLRHWAFDSHGYDLGIFTNVMWNLTHGNGYVSSVKGGINLFTDHQSPSYWLLAPLFWAVPRPETLLFAQACGLAAGGPALYYLAAARFGRGHWAAAALPWLYWTYLPLRNANAFDFHPEVFMLPLFLWGFAGLASERRSAKALGLLALAAALGTKESAPVVAVGIGIAWAIIGARWRGTALAAVGVALFFFDVKVAPGLFGGSEYAYMGLYGRFGSGIGDLLLAPFAQPVNFFSQLIDRERLIFLFWTLAPLGFLPLFDWRAALAALPPYVMLFLSEGDQRVRLVFHYGIEPGSALFWALPFGLAAFAKRFGWQRAGVWMLVWAFACHGESELFRARTYAPGAHSEWLATEILPCVNTAAPMAASDTLIPHLAARAWIGYPDQLEQRPSGDAVSCVVTDLKLGLNWPLGRGGVERVLATLPERSYREAWRCGTFSVYERAGSDCMRCVPRCDQ
jgi:uncharacterized membrane protein